MSTRAGIIIKDSYQEIHFYRHSDGYPNGTLPSLEKFLDLVKANKLRSDAMQSSGWLVLIGAEEEGYENSLSRLRYTTKGDGYSWKVGAYEPTSNVNTHGDLEYIYTIDLVSKEITVKEL